MDNPNLDGIRKLATQVSVGPEFDKRFLTTLVSSMGADAGAIWRRSQDPFMIVTQYSNDGPFQIALTKNEHDDLLQRAFDSPSPLVARSAKNGVVDSASTTLFLGRYNRTSLQTIELVFKNKISEENAGGLLRVFKEALNIVSQSDIEQVANDMATPVSNSVDRLTRDGISGYLTAIHSSIDRKLTCSNVANETRRLLDCDRISVLMKSRGKFRLVAISGQVSVNRRSNTVSLLEKLSARLLRTGEHFWYPDETEIPSQINTVLDDYLGLSATRSLVVAPIYQKLEETIEDPESNERKENPVIGGIVYEHFHEQWSEDEVSELVDFTLQHGGNAIRNANRHHAIFLYPLWNMLGKSKVLTAPRILPKTLLVSAVLALVAIVSIFWKVDFYVSANGILVPANLRRVYAQVDGDVNELFVDHGTMVGAGETLVVLTSREQELRIKEVESNIRNARQRLETIEDRRFNQPEEGGGVQENIGALVAQIENYENQLEILNQISNQMTIKSPMEGMVISWDLKRRLVDRPVQRGQVLMEIAEVDGDWVLEIQLADRRIGHLMRALDRAKGRRLPVTFLLAADTSKRFSGTLVEVAQATDISGDNKQIISLRVEIDSDEIELSQARTGITAKIQCGRSSLGYLWLHDINEFLQKNVFFYFA